MRFIDERFRQEPGQYVLQSLLAFAVIAGVVLVMGALTNGAIVAALGASSFVVFAMPRYKTARPRNLIGGHVLCMAIGAVCSIPLRMHLVPQGGLPQGLLAAAAVSLALFGMVVTDTEHPPAAGNALAFAVTPVELEHALFTLGAVVLLAFVRRGLRTWLKDLA